MIAAALLLSSLAAPPAPCARAAAARSTSTPAPGVLHVFQNGERYPLRLVWLDPKGKRVDLGTIAPGAFRSLQTYVGHVFTLVDPAGRCRSAVRIGDGLTGTYVGTSRYRPVAVTPGWQVFVDQALDPTAEPARTALATIARMLAQVNATLPSAALAQVRVTPIFLHDHAGPGGMFHRNPDWLVAHGRTVEMVNGIEISDAGVFVETAKVQPGTILHELAHAYHMRLLDEDRTRIDQVYRRAMETGRYRSVKRHDGSTTDAYARTDAAEYFAELTEAYFSRNDFFPFTRTELATYDPDGARLIRELWR